MDETTLKLAQELSRFSRLCYDRKLVGAAGGNLSVRLPQGERFLVTASGLSLRDISPENLLVVDAEGKVVEGPPLKPSKEIGFHLSLYQARPEVNAIIHVHPPYAVALTMAGRTIPAATISAQLKLVQGPLVSDCPPGSPELCREVAEAAAAASDQATILLLRRHGVVAFASSLSAAFDDAELAEDTAKIAFLAEQARTPLPALADFDVVDLSLPLNEATPYYPTDPPFRMTWHVEMPKQGAWVSRLDFGAHSGTHVDAPLHFLEGGASLGQMPVEAFLGPALVVDAPKQLGEDLVPEDVAGLDLQAGDMVLFRTGWDRRAGTPRFFQDEWPGFSAELLELLAAKGVKAVGGDMPSADSPAALQAGQPGHKTAHRAGLPIFEALVNLERLVGRRVFFIALPLNIEQGEASPLRAVALVPRSGG